jgi:hypothetical protein
MWAVLGWLSLLCRLLWEIALANCKRRLSDAVTRPDLWSDMARVVLAKQRRKIEMNAQKNRERTAATNKDLITVITEELSLTSEVLRNGDWVTEDLMKFQRKIIIEAMIDKLDWLMFSPKGTDAYIAQTRERVMNAQRRFTGDEISTMFLKGAIAEAKNASLKHSMMVDFNAKLQRAYIDLTGDEYTPFNRVKRSNVRSDEPTDMPADIAAELAALGMAPDLDTVANTSGVNDTRDIA